MSIDILNYKEIAGNPSIVAEFDLYMINSQMTFHKLKLIRTKKGHLFIAIPTWCEKMEDDTKKYHPYITFSKTKEESFQKMVMEKLKDTGFIL